MVQQELIADYACITGEGPLWHSMEQRLYWIDIPTGRMFCYDPATQQHQQCYQGDTIGGFTIQADGSLLLFMAKGAIKIWRNGQLTTIINDIADERESRFNDVIADPSGRVFCGTMPTAEHPGRLYRLDLDGTLTLLLDDVACSNGMGFTPDRKQMYYTDSLKHTIYRFDYDQATGGLSNKQAFLVAPENAGLPDGLTVDAEGGIWSAYWDGGCIVRYMADGTEVQRISFPARKVSSITFGGPDYREMYVTTAGGDDKAREGAGAGALFRLTPGVSGVPEFLSRIGL
jgi:sugar lactone lactonase YvrE